MADDDNGEWEPKEWKNIGPINTCPYIVTQKEC